MSSNKGADQLRSRYQEVNAWYGRGLISEFEWNEQKDLLDFPFKETNVFYRTCLYPLFGRDVRHLGKFELWYAHQCMKKDWKTNLGHLKASADKREEEYKLEQRKRRVTERIMAW